MFDFLSVRVSLNSYKWLLTEQDAFCWHVSQCHQFSSLGALSSPSRLLSTHSCPNQTHKHTHVKTHTPICTEHIDQPGLRLEWFMTEGAIHIHVPTISFHLGTKEGGGRRTKKWAKMTEKIPIVYLYGTLFQKEESDRKKRLVSLLYCRDDRFIVSIK